MAVFDFPYHQVQDEYPESSLSIRFGRGYQFASRPMGPDQINLRLSFPTLFWVFNSGGSLTALTEPKINLKTLIEFYEAHLLYEKFTYNHPLRGTIECRFAKPLVTPKGIRGAVASKDSHKFHAVEPFEIQLVTQP